MSASALPIISTTGKQHRGQRDREGRAADRAAIDRGGRAAGAAGRAVGLVAGAAGAAVTALVVEQVRGGHVHPARRVAGEERAGDRHGRQRDQHAEGKGDAEVGVQGGDRDQRAGVWRHETVHYRQAGQGRDAHLDQRQAGAPGDQEDHRHQQHEADLEEHR